MGAMEVERLVLKSTFVKESLSKSDAMTTEMINILSSFDEQLSSLEAAMRPTQIRTHALTKAHQNIDSTLHAAESVLAQFDVSRQVEPRLLEGPRGDFDGYFAAVDQLQTAVDFFTQNRSYKSSDAALHHAKGLLNKALGKLEEEFRRMLAANSKSQDPAALFAMLPEKYKPTPAASSSDTIGSATSRKPPPEPQPPTPPETIETLQLLPANVIPQLHGMAKQLLAGGFSQQCTKGYKDVRGATILQSLKRLGLEKLTREEVQKMQWEVLETKIGSWIQYLRIAVKLLLASERKLCDQVFYRLDPDRTAVFCEVAAESMATLLSFGDSVAKSKKSPEKLFVLLDMYETLRDLMPDVDVTFAGEACATIREAAKGLLKRVAETALGTFAEFEEAVDKDVSKHSVTDGTVHPLTSYVINYVKYLLDYQATLKELFREGDVEKQATQLAVATTRIMGVLQQNLDGKSKVYKNPALTQLFMMNNMHYMVRSVKRSEARELLGDDWVQRHRRTVQQHATAYQRSSWGKVTTLLTGQGLQAGGQEGAVNRQAVKDRFKAFNTSFEELYASQTQWVIPDPELREAVRLQVAEVLLPAYRSFLKRYGSILEGGKNPGKYIKYAPEDLERMLGDFFEGGNRR